MNENSNDKTRGERIVAALAALDRGWRDGAFFGEGVVENDIRAALRDIFVEAYPLREQLGALVALVFEVVVAGGAGERGDAPEAINARAVRRIVEGFFDESDFDEIFEVIRAAVERLDEGAAHYGVANRHRLADLAFEGFDPRERLAFEIGRAMAAGLSFADIAEVSLDSEAARRRQTPPDAAEGVEGVEASTQPAEAPDEAHTAREGEGG